MSQIPPYVPALGWESLACLLTTPQARAAGPAGIQEIAVRDRPTMAHGLCDADFEHISQGGTLPAFDFTGCGCFSWPLGCYSWLPALPDLLTQARSRPVEQFVEEDSQSTNGDADEELQLHVIHG